MIKEMVFGLLGGLGLFLFGMKAVGDALEDGRHLNATQLGFRRSHVKRMRGGRHPSEGGLILIDLADNIEKIGDHLANIAQAVIGILQWAEIEPRIAANPRRADRLTPIMEIRRSQEQS